MTLSLPLKDCTLSIISCYAPTLPSSDGAKEAFYGALNDTINSVPSSHKLLVMGDFNARVGADHSSWEDVIGKHGVGNENSNGTLLLSLCSQQGLVITNTIFQQADRHKTTWMHPRTKKWHMIDYVITRQRDIKDINHTRAMCCQVSGNVCYGTDPSPRFIYFSFSRWYSAPWIGIYIYIFYLYNIFSQGRITTSTYIYFNFSKKNIKLYLLLHV